MATASPPQDELITATINQKEYQMSSLLTAKTDPKSNVTSEEPLATSTTNAVVSTRYHHDKPWAKHAKKPLKRNHVKPWAKHAKKPLKRIDIERFLRKLLVDEYSFKESRQQRGNKFCVFFARLLMQIATISRHKECSRYSNWMKEELANLELLLYEALHSIDENFELWFDIAYNAEFYIVDHLPENESVIFYEAMVKASKRYSPRQYALMLCSLGQVLRTAHKRVPEAYDQYMKALDVLFPLGDSRDLATLYSHIGQIWYDKGVLKESERYVQ